MLTVLEAIKQYPQYFQLSCLGRSRTTPSDVNRKNHIDLAAAIEVKAWDEVKNILDKPQYYKPLEGVIYCLGDYSSIDNSVHHVIVDMFHQGHITERK